LKQLRATERLAQLEGLCHMWDVALLSTAAPPVIWDVAAAAACLQQEGLLPHSNERSEVKADPKTRVIMTMHLAAAAAAGGHSCI
jgi:hypothetical protein